MNGHNQNDSPSIEVLLGHITALQLILGGLLAKLERDGIYKEEELKGFLDSLGIPGGKTLALDAGAQVRFADGNRALFQSRDQIRALLKPGIV